jgi:hypothetical protein
LYIVGWLPPDTPTSAGSRKAVGVFRKLNAHTFALSGTKMAVGEATWLEKIGDACSSVGVLTDHIIVERENRWFAVRKKVLQVMQASDPSQNVEEKRFSITGGRRGTMMRPWNPCKCNEESA